MNGNEKYKNLSIGLTILLILMGMVMFILFSSYNDLKEQNKDLLIKSSDYDELVDEFNLSESDNDSLNEYIDELDGQLDYFMNTAVFVTEHGKKYHKATCGYIQNSDGVFIYNIENAEAKGYEPCSRCFNDSYDWRDHLDNNAWSNN